MPAIGFPALQRMNSLPCSTPRSSGKRFRRVCKTLSMGCAKRGIRRHTVATFPLSEPRNYSSTHSNSSHWWSAAARGEKPGPFPTFIPPPEEHKFIAAAGREEELAAKIAELEKQQANYEALSRQPAELDSIRAETEPSANLLHLSESETRQRLIDRDLAAAGWKVGHQGASTAEVTQEHPLATGERADYVLWDVNGKPLAVVEAKKTSRDVEAGRKQAALYADALEKQYGQRPVIFTTNGHDIEIWEHGYPPRAIFGFYSKDSLQYSVYQRVAKKPLAQITIDPAITNRLYQIEAIRRVSERFTANFRKSLIVQATGTGKTRVAISLTDVLMRAGWVKRVLFLCDRTELRKQARNAFR